MVSPELGLGEGQAEVEAGAVGIGILHPDDPAVPLDGLQAEGQAQAHVAHVPLHVFLEELPENLGARLRRDARAGVRDGDPRLAVEDLEAIRKALGFEKWVVLGYSYGGFLAHLTAWCEERELPYEGVPVGTIKRFATGKGNAGKDAVIAAIKARGFNPTDDNEADALAILLWAIDAQGGAA